MAAHTRRSLPSSVLLPSLFALCAALSTPAAFAQGAGNYPDATFTLRLAFGQVKGYTQDGKAIPPWTTIGGDVTGSF